MFKHILVPLDGSLLSEAALEPASYLAGKLKARVTLLHVIEEDAPEQVHHERHLSDPAEAERYLKEVASRYFPIRTHTTSGKKTQIRIHVHRAPVADVARSIVEHAEQELKPDLIITCTHGRGGIRDFLYGSIAQKVVNQGSKPLLLVKPGSGKFKLKRALVPLDPDSVHDDCLPIIMELAKSFKAEIMLLSVVPNLGTLPGEQAAAGNLLPATAQTFLDMREENTLAHLHEHVLEFREKKLRAKAQVVRGEPANRIVVTAEEQKADLIILCTHGKAGTGAFWSRSVAPKVASKTTTPLLLIPISSSTSR